MLVWTRRFMKATLHSMKDSGLELKDCTLFPAKPKRRYLAVRCFKGNARNAERSLAIPRGLWIEVSKEFRGNFGVSQLLEGLFLAGFSVGWTEARHVQGRK